MDFLFNKFIPNSSNTKIILRPAGKTFITGISPGYEVRYDKILENYINEKEYIYVMERLNDDIVNMWPCCYCFSYGYFCCLCTLGIFLLKFIGLSFLLPCICISEAKSTLLDKIEILNDSIFHSKNLKLTFRSRCSTSWLEIEILKSEYINIIENINTEQRQIQFSNNQI